MNPAPGFMEAFLHVCKTVNFKGRARRAEYWKFVLLWNLFYIPMYLIKAPPVKPTRPMSVSGQAKMGTVTPGICGH